MVNKNNKDDLIKFFFWTGGIILGMIVLIAYGFYLVDGNYLKGLDAQITNYIEEQWNSSR